MAEYFYGLRAPNNEIISILDVPIEETGLACGCICPECKRKFEACSLRGKNVKPYFRHSSLDFEQKGAYDCSPEKVHETALHEMAKSIIYEEGKIAIPAVDVSIWDVSIKDIPDYIRKKLPEFLFEEEFFVECTNVAVERFDENRLKPDIIIDSDKGRFYIEIYVTNKKKTEYYHRVSNLGIPTYEIDLSELKNSRISKEELKKIVVEGVGRKGRWIYHPSMSDALDAAREYYINHSVVKEFFSKQYLEKNTVIQGNLDERSDKFKSVSEDFISSYDENAPKQSLDEILRLSKAEQTYLENADFDQDGEPIFNRYGTRMIKCMKCNKIKPSGAIFNPGTGNKGICRDCAMKNNII